MIKTGQMIHINLFGRSSKKAVVFLGHYKNVPELTKYLTSCGKILSRRVTGLSRVQQKNLRLHVMVARYLGLLPCSSRH